MNSKTVRERLENKIAIEELLSNNDRMMHIILPDWEDSAIEKKSRRSLALLELAHRELPRYLFLAWFHRYALGRSYRQLEDEGMKFPRINANAAVREMKSVLIEYELLGLSI